MEVVRTGRALGAEIRGVDLSQDVDDATFRRIDDAFNEHGLIYFRGQKITEAQQIRFARRFGELEINVNTEYCLEGSS
jgi:taurine dioxygenase